MSDNIPEAITTKKGRFSVVWIIPLLALLLGGWLTFKYLHEQGTVIQIEFASAEGLTAGKTMVKYKDVEIGLVESISFTPNLKSVIVTATIDRNMNGHLNDDTRFWVVRARVAAGKVSGLSTLLAGAHIGMEPGKSSNQRQKFVGLEKPPVLYTEDQGTHFKLQTENIHSLESGAPIYYRRLKVGEVIDYTLNEQGTEFEIGIFIKKPYDNFVRESTLFWNASGVDVKIGTDGLEMQSESLVSLLLGGVAFDNLTKNNDEPAAPGTVYNLYDNKETAANTEFKRSDEQYRLYFDGSARGLHAGAPVTLRGITIGYVTDVRLEYDIEKEAFEIPVTVEFEPGRFSIIGDTTGKGEVLTAESLISQGLRAQLLTGNLLTGQMLIDLDIYPDVEAVTPSYEGEYLVLPTIPTTIDSLKISLTGFLDKIAQLPLDEIGVNLNQTLAGINSLVNSSEAKESLSNVDSVTAQLDKTLKEIEGVAAGFSENSDAYQALLRTMHELSGASRSLKLMAEYLERHPEALLRGKPN